MASGCQALTDSSRCYTDPAKPGRNAGDCRPWRVEPALSREQPANVGPNAGDCRRRRWFSEPSPFRTLLPASRDRLNMRRRLCYTNTFLENRPRGGFKNLAPAHGKTGPFHGSGRSPTGRPLVAGQVKQPAPHPRPGTLWLVRPSGRHPLRPALAGRSCHSLSPVWRRAFRWSFDPCLTSAWLSARNCCC